MDPLSDVLWLLKPESVVSGGFQVEDDVAISFPKHEGIKCYAVLSGQCWLSIEGADPLLLTTGDCFLLPRGLPFALSSDPSLQPVDYRTFLNTYRPENTPSQQAAGNYIAGGFFRLSGIHASILLQSLPPIVHIRKESDKAAMRWSLERMKEELRDPQPGGSLITQQLAYMMLVQALRLHLAEGATAGVSWLFALADKQMSTALACIHDDPGHPWTIRNLAGHIGMSRSVFALKFKQMVGATPMEYLTRWRMLLAAHRLTNSNEPVSVIALSLGYASESAFSKAFRREMIVSPRQYRRGLSPVAQETRERVAQTVPA